MQGGGDVLINRFCKDFNQSEFKIFFDEKNDKFTVCMITSKGSIISLAEMSEIETKAAIEINFKKNSINNSTDDNLLDNTEAESVANEKMKIFKNFLALQRNISSIIESLNLYYEKGYVGNNLEFVKFLFEF